jgi:hypothetical protein
MRTDHVLTTPDQEGIAKPLRADLDFEGIMKLALLVLMGLLLSQEPSLPVGTGRIAGTILNAETGTPLKDATVTLSPHRFANSNNPSVQSPARMADSFSTASRRETIR